MALKIPNTICKNRNCTKGKDGGRRIFYSCKYCVHTISKQSIACCDECYEEYLAQVAEARQQHQQMDLFPERTDMSKDEVYDLIMTASTEDVIRETEEELAEELSEDPMLGYGLIVCRINEQLNEKNEEGDA